VSGIGKAAAEEAAWAKLQRSAVWWLGEHANAAALEYAGDNEAVKATAAINAAMQRTTSPGEIIAMQVMGDSYGTKNALPFSAIMTGASQGGAAQSQDNSEHQNGITMKHCLHTERQ